MPMKTRNVWLLAFAAIAATTLSLQAQDSQGTPVVLGGLKSAAPADWKAQKSSSEMRAYQFKLPKADGDKEDAELVIFHFGPQGGGTVPDNIKRWKAMFVPPSGKTIDDVAKVSELKVGDADVTYLALEGTYKFKERPFDPNAKEELKPDWRMVGIVFGSKNGPYYIRFVGPAKTVAKHQKAFDEWLKAFK
jgi:hypothetical protein